MTMRAACLLLVGAHALCQLSAAAPLRTRWSPTALGPNVTLLGGVVMPSLGLGSSGGCHPGAPMPTGPRLPYRPGPPPPSDTPRLIICDVGCSSTSDILGLIMIH